MKKWLIPLLILTMLVAIVGCTPAEPTTTPSSSLEADAPSSTAPTQPTETTKPVPALPGGTKPAPTEPSTTASTAPTTTATTVPQIAEQLSLGSTMPDFTITDVYGESYTLYELLSEKQMVMLNFWFIECPYCVIEFPHINEAYLQYQDQIALLAVSPYDSAAAIKAFTYTQGLDFPTLQDQVGLARAFRVNSYPTTVIIDRYGVVCLVQIGAVPDTQLFLNVFAYFTAEDYETQLFSDIEEIGA